MYLNSRSIETFLAVFKWKYVIGMKKIVSPHLLLSFFHFKVTEYSWIETDECMPDGVIFSMRKGSWRSSNKPFHLRIRWTINKFQLCIYFLTTSEADQQPGHWRISRKAFQELALFYLFSFHLNKGRIPKNRSFFSLLFFHLLWR